MDSWGLAGPGHFALFLLALGVLALAERLLVAVRSRPSVRVRRPSQRRPMYASAIGQADHSSCTYKAKRRTRAV